MMLLSFVTIPAGGLATYLHADYVQEKVKSKVQPRKIPVHAFSDGG